MEYRGPGPVEQSGPSVAAVDVLGLGVGVACVAALVSIPFVHIVLVFFLLRRVVVDNGLDSSYLRNEIIAAWFLGWLFSVVVAWF